MRASRARIRSRALHVATVLTIPCVGLADQHVRPIERPAQYTQSCTPISLQSRPLSTRIEGLVGLWTEDGEPGPRPEEEVLSALGLQNEAIAPTAPPGSH